jgi:putative IMPACT (imprinted ancient) family translation regulator
MLCICRFFGGTKLGTGGLVRAYGKVTTECLKNASTITIKAKVFSLKR